MMLEKGFVILAYTGNDANPAVNYAKANDWTTDDVKIVRCEGQILIKTKREIDARNKCDEANNEILEREWLHSIQK